MSYYKVFILHLDNFGRQNHSPHEKCYTVHYTKDLGRIMGDYSFNRGRNSYVNRCYNNARIFLKYVEYVNGSRTDAISRVKQLKRMTTERKQALFLNENNQLVNYIPNKVIVLKKNYKPTEQVKCLIV